MLVEEKVEKKFLSPMSLDQRDRLSSDLRYPILIC
jgi:hypothetical protein